MSNLNIKTLSYRFGVYQWREKFWFWLSDRLPAELVYFAAIRLIAYATSGKYGAVNVHELNPMDVLKTWSDEHGLRG